MKKPDLVVGTSIKIQQLKIRHLSLRRIIPMHSQSSAWIKMIELVVVVVVVV
jgi:hypothetical protein